MCSEISTFHWIEKKKSRVQGLLVLCRSVWKRQQARQIAKVRKYPLRAVLLNFRRYIRKGFIVK